MTVNLTKHCTVIKIGLILKSPGPPVYGRGFWAKATNQMISCHYTGWKCHVEGRRCTQFSGRYATVSLVYPLVFSKSGGMLLTVLSWLCSSLLASVSGGKLPEAEVKIEVLHRPFLCHRKSKYGDILLVHQEGYFENGTLFHSRYAMASRGTRNSLQGRGNLGEVLLHFCISSTKWRDLISVWQNICLRFAVTCCLLKCKCIETPWWRGATWQNN